MLLMLMLLGWHMMLLLMLLLSTTLQTFTFTGTGAGGNDVNQWKRVRTDTDTDADERSLNLPYMCWLLQLFLDFEKYCQFHLFQTRWNNRSYPRPATKSSSEQQLERKRRWTDIMDISQICGRHCWNCTYSIPGWNNCHRRCHIHKRLQVQE